MSGLRLIVGAFAAVFAALSPVRAQAPDILTYAGADREARLVEGARAEKEVVLYATIIVNQAMRPLADSFMKKYPFVKMTFWRGDPGDIITKVATEARGGRPVADVLEGPGVGEAAIEAGLVTPYTTPASRNYPEALRDPRNLWTASRLSYFSLGYNTKLVPPGTQPKTYEDLLDPKWKGRMAWRIGTSGGTPLFITSLRVAWGEDRAMAYFRKLAEQKIVNFGAGSARTLVDRMIAGEYPIALQIFAHHPLISAGKGAPASSQLLDPVTVTNSTLLIPKGVRHPHAALLLVDYILSREGQETLAKAEYYPALPGVAALPELDAVVPARAGYSENFLTPETIAKYSDSSEKIWTDLFR